MLYCDKTARSRESKALFDIGNWISVEMAPEFGLDTTTRNKSGLYSRDLDLMLHQYWILNNKVFTHERLRVQLAVALILAGATSTRPGALIENLCYKDVQFNVFPPAPGITRARIGMVVTLRKTKRTAGRSRPKKYGFHEEDTLLRDPILYIENDFQSPENFYSLHNQSRLILPWKEE